ncbi:MAG: hypothetical protein ACXU8U_01980 [Asticcacaulis sp.]
MMPEPKHKLFGIPLSEWIEKIPNELELDAVGLWQIIPTFKEEFGLEGANLQVALSQAIAALMLRGAVPVDGVTWSRKENYGTTPLEIAANVMKEIEARKITPDLEGLWFAIPDDSASV